MHDLPLENILRFHSQSSLYGRYGDTLLKLPTGLLSYLVGIMHGSQVMPPEATPEEWSRFLLPLGSNLVLPALYWRIRSLPEKFHPPGDVLSGMRQAFLRCRALSLRMERQLKEILRACETAGIDVMVWKGAALARTTYPDPALRPSGDIDLLVRPSQFLSVRPILEKLGYQSEGKWFEVLQPYGFAEDFFPPKTHEGYVKVDVHWKLHPYEGTRGDRDERDLFRRAVSAKLGNTAFLTPCPVDALIIAALHMFLRHPHESRLIWIMDVSLLAGKLEFPEEWNELLALSLEWRACLALERAFKMASLWTGLILPSGFEDYTKWPKPSVHEKKLFTHALYSREHKTSLFRLYWPGWKRPIKTCRFLFRLLLPHPVYVRWKYPVPNRFFLPLSYMRCWLGWLGWDTRTGPSTIPPSRALSHKTPA